MHLDTMSLGAPFDHNMMAMSSPVVSGGGIAAAAATTTGWPSGATNEHIIQAVNQIIATSDLMNVTKKQVREQIVAQFGMNEEESRARRKFINETIANCLNQI